TGQRGGGRVVVTPRGRQRQRRTAGHGHADDAPRVVEGVHAGEGGGQLLVQEGVPAVHAQYRVRVLPVRVQAEPAALGARDHHVLVGEELLVVGVIGPADVVLSPTDTVEQEQQRRGRGALREQHEGGDGLLHRGRPDVRQHLASLDRLDPQHLRRGRVGGRRGRRPGRGGEAHGRRRVHPCRGLAPGDGGAGRGHHHGGDHGDDGGHRRGGGGRGGRGRATSVHSGHSS